MGGTILTFNFNNMKKWGKWKDFKIVVSNSAIYYLIQVQEREDGKKRFRRTNITGDIYNRPTTTLTLEDLSNLK